MLDACSNELSCHRGRVSRHSRRGLAYLGGHAACVLLLALAASRPSAAQNGLASSSAFGESVSVQVLPVLGSPVQITSGPLPYVSGSAPPAYSLTGQLAVVQVASPQLGLLLQASLLQVDAAAQEPATDQVSADATVAHVQLEIAGLLPALGLGAQAVSSSAQIVGPCDSQPVATGSTVLVGVQLSGPLGLGLSVQSRPAPNTVLLNAAGIRVVLNEQILSSDGTATDLTVNAVHVSVQELPVGLSLLSGDIILSQSHAHLACVQRPPPVL